MDDTRTICSMIGKFPENPKYWSTEHFRNSRRSNSMRPIKMSKAERSSSYNLQKITMC